MCQTSIIACLVLIVHCGHGVEDFKNDEDRLTLVMFLQELTGPPSTLQRTRSIPMLRDIPPGQKIESNIL